MNRCTLLAAALLAFAAAAFADPPQTGVVKDRAGYFPVRKYAPLPGKAVGVLLGDARDVVALDGRSGPPDALVFSVGGNSCRWVYVPTSENPQITNLQVPVGADGKKEIYPALNMANPRHVLPWGVTAPYSLVEVAVNSGLGSPADEGFVATNIRVLDGSKEFPLKVADAIADMKKRYGDFLKSKDADVEKAMAETAVKSLKDRKPTGPREQSELMYVTWMPQTETLQVRFKTRITDGAYTIANADGPKLDIRPVDPAPPQDVPNSGALARIAPRKGLKTRIGTAFGIEVGRAYEVNKQGEIIRIDELPIESFTQEVKSQLIGPGPGPLPKLRPLPAPILPRNDAQGAVQPIRHIAELAAGAAGKGDEKPQAGKEPKVLARAYWPHGKADPKSKKGETVAIKSASELAGRSPWSELDANSQVVEKMATQAVATLLKVPDIDWNKQMLIVVTAGPRPTGGWKVNIDALKVSGKTLAVEWSVTPPTGIVTQAFTHPGQVILVERFDGPVTFEMAAKKRE